MKRRSTILISLLVATATLALGQTAAAPFRAGEYNSAAFQTLSITNGQTVTATVGVFAMQQRIEVTTTGSPTSARLVITGCLSLGTCEFLGIWDSVTAGILYLPGQYDTLKLTSTLAGGSSPTHAVYIEAVPSESWATQTAYSPAQMNLNSATLPISGTTADSAIISLVNVRAMTVYFNCGQSANFNVKHYAEDGTTLLRSDLSVATASTANTWAEYELTSGQRNVINATAGSIAFTLPGAAASFSLTNTTANASTCSLRTVAQY